MGDEVIKLNEVLVNSRRYPIKGSITQMLTSQFAPKQVIGDYGLDSDPNTSKWVVNDNRGGLLIEEMDEQKDIGRHWWSTSNTEFKGHLMLPSLATDCGAGGLSSKDGYVLFDYNGEVYVALDEFLRVFDNGNTDFNDAIVTLPSNPTDAKECIRAMFVACGNDGYYYNPKLFVEDKLLNGSLEKWATSTNLTNWTEVLTGAGAAITQESAAANVDSGKYSAKLYSGVGTGGGVAPYSTNAAHIYQDIAWLDEYKGKEFTVTVRASTDDGGQNTWLIIDDGVGKTSTAIGSGWDTNTVTRTLDASATRLRIVIEAAALSSSPGTAETAYVDTVTLTYSESTAPFILQGATAKLFVEWDAKAWKIDSKNQLSYSTDCVAWTDNGKIDIDDDATNNLYVDKDASGNTIIYAATKQGLWAHDTDNAQWILTQLQPPDHETSGKGATVWEDAAYVSAGLDVFKYEVDTPARLGSIGLSSQDGIPSEYDGEIVAMIPAHHELFTLVDASEVAGTGYSSVMSWNGNSWRARWVSGTADKAIKCGLVSSAYSSYRFYFATDNKVYYIPLHKSVRNPLKISTDTYGAASVHITPWFDANWQVGNKLALSAKVKVLNASANETVVVKYRIDHATTALAATWTTLGTITSAGETEYTFASSVGVLFKAIQFRLELVRGGTTTNTPDVQYLILSYQKVIPPKWGWRFTVNCTKTYDGYTPKQMLDNIVTAAETQTLVTFLFRNTTKYVQIKDITCTKATGRNDQGTYEVFVQEV